MGLNLIKILKYSVITLNSIVTICGLILLIAGSVVQSEINRSKLSITVGGYALPAGSIISIVMGIFTIFIGIFGIYSAVKEKFRFLYLYTTLMIVMFLIKLITGSIGVGTKNNSKFSQNVYRIFANDLSFNSTQLAKRDFYQQHFKCCGWNGLNDYIISDNRMSVPLSCCRFVENCNVNDISQLFNIPCSKSILPLIAQYCETVGIILIVFAIIDFISIFLSGIYARKLKLN